MKNTKDKRIVIVGATQSCVAIQVAKRFVITSTPKTFNNEKSVETR